MKTLLDQAEIKKGVEDLANKIAEEYGDQPLTIIGIMTGCIIFMADVIRLLEMPLRVGVVQTSSYEGTKRGNLKINAEMMPDITDRDVLLMDDIFDTGHTLKEVLRQMNEWNPRSLKSAVLLSKTGRQEVDFSPDFVVFDIPDEFVVGYGLDYEDEYRNLPFVAALEPADIQSAVK